MTDAPHAYPLAWPAGWPRTRTGFRKEPKFSAKTATADGLYRPTRALTTAEATKRLMHELGRIGARHVVVSTNLQIGAKGGILSGQRKPDDPGACVYFQLKGKPTTLPCDRYRTVEGNIAAIAAHIEATRAIERHGVGTLDQMFTGFQAIRGPGPKPWREVLGIRPEERVTRDLIREKRNALARQHHPDAGGDPAIMAEINAAADTAYGQVSPAASFNG